ncbi:MAG: hypothetical protein AAFU77_14110 [Myxococcota bacterium]
MTRLKRHIPTLLLDGLVIAAALQPRGFVGDPQWLTVFEQQSSLVFVMVWIAGRALLWAPALRGHWRGVLLRVILRWIPLAAVMGLAACVRKLRGVGEWPPLEGGPVLFECWSFAIGALHQPWLRPELVAPALEALLLVVVSVLLETWEQYRNASSERQSRRRRQREDDPDRESNPKPSR